MSSAYQNVITSYHSFSPLAEDEPQFRPAQRALFSSISALYPTLGLSPVAELSKDVFYQYAKLVNRGEAFRDSPGSLTRLTPLAANYCLTFNEIISSLQNPPQQPASLKEKLDRFGATHLQFAIAVSGEFVKVAPDASPSINVNYPQTLTLFLDVVLPHIKELKDEIEGADKTFLSLKLPCLTLEKLLSNPTDLPEFFAPYSATLIKKNKTWADLSPAEKNNLHRKIMGEDIALAPVTKELYKSICDLSYHMNLKEYLMISKETCKELDTAFQILDSLPQQRTEPAKDLIRAILSNKELPFPEALSFYEKYRLTLEEMREKGATPQEIDQLAVKIAAEPKVVPWLKLILNH